MARRAPRQYKSGPKKGQFMSKRAASAKRRPKKRRKARRNPGATVARRNQPAKRRAPARRRAAARPAVAKRRRPRRNPPRRLNIVQSLTDGAIEAGQILIGKAVARSVPDMAGLPKEGNMGLAIQAGVAIASGFVAEMFLSKAAARAILAGGLTAPLETVIVAYRVPWLSQALSPVSATNDLGAYVRNRGMGAYVRERLPSSTGERGLGSYAAARGAY